ncbi:MAG TPA: ATP-binding cassette domain-containing protein [Bryobacteraceae bacterium]|nr:ATP-binding cassette domain-containing protein [Bryobacteraceae bacterium]
MLQVNGLCKRLPDGRAILSDLNFRVEKGEFVALLGASGAGKSMTMRAIVGLTSVGSGSVVFTGETGKTYTTTTASGKELRRARRNIGVIFQGCNLVRRLPVLDNVMIGRLGRIHPLRSWLYGFTDREATEAMEALDRVGMADFASRVTGSLSGGEMQRVAIARAIFQRPLCYLADEPIASLDPKNAESIMQLLQPLARENPILGAFHQPEMVMRYCTRVIALRKGKIIYDGSPRLDAAELAEIYGSELNRPALTMAAPAAVER